MSPKRRPVWMITVISFLLAFISFASLRNRSSFANIRTIDAVQLVTVGMLLGCGLVALFLALRRGGGSPVA